MTNFTPAPWFPVDEYGDGKQADWCVMVPEESPYGPYVATVHATADHAKANAHLIASAPELYEALDDLWEWVRNWSPEFMDDDDFDRSKYESALAKARGEQS